MSKYNEIPVPFLLKQYKTGGFSQGLMDASMEHLEQLYDESIKPPVFLYEEHSIAEEYKKALATRFTMVMYAKGSRPPQII